MQKPSVYTCEHGCPLDSDCLMCDMEKEYRRSNVYAAVGIALFVLLAVWLIVFAGVS